VKHDPYVVLGVAPDSGPGEWKRAFRRLAMRWHPDRNDHPEATERFKEINAAYERLTSVESPEAESPEEAAPEPAPDERPEPSPKAADIRLNLEISIEEGSLGCRKTVHYTRGKACQTCDGSGEAGMSRTRFCEACHGSGRVRDAKRTLVACGACGGRGFFTERICPDCGGCGRHTTEVSLQIKVPPGMLPGDELRVAGQGEPGDDACVAGDLYLTLVLRSHPLYQMNGRDIAYTMPVSALAMLAGDEITLPTPLGPLRQTLMPGAAGVRDIHLPGKGYPGRGKHGAGDLLVSLTPVFPARLSEAQRKLLLKASAAIQADAETTVPEVAAWQRNNGLA
jgi:molecular chaperone DnaJ